MSTLLNMQRINYNSPAGRQFSQMSKEELADFCTYCWTTSQAPTLALVREFRKGWAAMRALRAEIEKLPL